MYGVNCFKAQSQTQSTIYINPCLKSLFHRANGKAGMGNGMGIRMGTKEWEQETATGMKMKKKVICYQL